MRKKSLLASLVFLVSFALFFSLFQLLIPKSNSKLKKQDFLTKTPPSLHYVALGDSLTQGVGDTTEQGGFVPILANSLTQGGAYQVSSVNFGVAGNTSQQILKRMTKDEAILPELARADLMTLTVGGNDVMAVIRRHLANLNISQFDKAQVGYQKNLRAIIELARQDNPDLPIYILGIYNPFYLNFPDMTEMQLVIDDWNAATQEVASSYHQVYFVPINDLLYKGIDGQGGIVSEGQGQTNIVNNALFEQDHFHPNIIGYRLMAKAVEEVIDDSAFNYPQN